MKFKATIFLLSSSLLLCTQLFATDQQELEMQKVLKIGKESSSLLLKTLGANMKEHMKVGGPMDALSFCSNEAYDLTNSVTQKLPQGVEIKRVSNNYRSAANMPTQNEKRVLDALETLQNANVVLPQELVEKVSADTYKYYKPITIESGVCLKCHGNIENEQLKSSTQKLYPNDKALGYKMHDLRGAVVVTIKTR